MGSEKNFENKIKKYIEDHDGWQVKFFANRMTKTGIPDILACINGYFVAIEVKAEHGKPSELQKHHINKINKVGGFGVILYPQDFELFESMIINLMNDDDYEAGELCDRINERSF